MESIVLPDGSGWVAAALPVVAAIIGTLYLKFKRSAKRDGVQNWKDVLVVFVDAVRKSLNTKEKEAEIKPKDKKPE